MNGSPPLAGGPLCRMAWGFMPEPVRLIATTVPMITQTAARAKEVAARNPEFVRVDQGQVVGVIPDREVYYGPPAGLPELREMVGRYWTAAYGLKGRDGIPPEGLGGEHVSIVSGGTEGLAILLRMVAQGRSVGLPRLHWGNYKGIIRLAGAEPVFLEFFNGAGDLDLEGLSRALEERSVRILILNYPHNPTGDDLTQEEMAALAGLARDRDLLLVADEVYGCMRFDGSRRSMLAWAPERTVCIGAASKEFVVPGARTAWVITADSVFSDEWYPRLTRAQSSSPNVLGQRLAMEMLGPDVEDLEAGRPPRHLSALNAEILKRRDRMAEVILAAGFTIDSRRGGLPEGGISMLGRLPAGREDDRAFLAKAMEMERFSAIPGSSFGEPGTIRFGYGGLDPDRIDRLGRYLLEVAEALS